EVAEIQSRIATGALVKIQHDKAALSPQKLRRAQVAVQERRGCWRRRRLALEPDQQATQRRCLGRKPRAEFGDARPNLAERGAGTRDAVGDDGSGMQDRQRASDPLQQAATVLLERLADGLARF